MTHTPTPWRVAGQAGLTIVGEDSHPIADTCFVNDEANAAFIVRAVNSHETLVSLLIEARASLAGGLETEDAMEPEFSKKDRELIAQIDTALAAEKEEAA